uniref:Uncharacterized protein n=1 Tax=Glossina brevipalpis TaxID=37001 RepID=A0A1A9W890_9MUSC
MISSCRFSIATCKGVLFSISKEFTFAPCPINVCKTFVSPHWQHKCNGDALSFDSSPPSPFGPDYVHAMKCFKCSVTEDISLKNDETLPNITPACSKFDSSSKFIVNCPYSTMCIKTISTMYLQHGLEQKTITRGCASQKSSTLVFRNGNWQKEDSVMDVYAAECKNIKWLNDICLVSKFYFWLLTLASFSTKHKKTTSSRCKRTAACNGYFVLLFNILKSKGPDICSKSCGVKSSQFVEINPEQYSSRLAAPTSSATQ